MKYRSCIAVAIVISIVLVEYVNACNNDEFQCNDRTCIHKSFKCDGEIDCADGSDELHCGCDDSNQISCSNGQCIQANERCKGVDDCGDNCSNITCKDHQFQCGDGLCIYKTFVCDGDEDCIDGSDEMNCALDESCQDSDKFLCNNGRCIMAHSHCDGTDDCADNSDELNCSEIKCRADEFQCDDKKCISMYWVCDKESDCMDSSDERNCTTQCQPTEFHCMDSNTCIDRNLYWLCDDDQDCPNGDDENDHNCGHRTTPANDDSTENSVNDCEVANGGCDHLCIVTPNGHDCNCTAGYKLKDATMCIDIDECEIPGTCSHRCTNEIGSYKCDCEEGYEKDPSNLNRCKAAVGGNASLLVGFQHDIRKISIDHPDVVSPMQNVNYTQSLTVFDYSYQTNELFWCDIGQQSVFRTSIDDKDGYNRETIRHFPNNTIVNGLAVDWIYKNIYYTQCLSSASLSYKCSIVVTNFDGTMETTLITHESGVPHAIALDPIQSFMYWTDCGKVPHIDRAGMDGFMPEIIVDGTKADIDRPIALTLDFTTDQIYWLDSKLKSISSCEFDGSNSRQILKSSEMLSLPYSLSVFEDFVYWTNGEKGAVLKANKFNGSDLQTVVESKTPMTIHVYHQLRQRNTKNYCSHESMMNISCSHICLPSRRSWYYERATCACPKNWRLSSDGHLCRPKLQYSNRIETNTTNIEMNAQMVHISSNTVLIISGVLFSIILIVSVAIYCYVKNKNNAANTSSV